MAAKIHKPYWKKYVRVALIIILFLITAITCLDIWFVKNANKLLINLVDRNSQGKLKLELSKATFDLFSNEVRIHKAKISSTAKNKNPITYNVGFSKVVLHTNSLWSFLFNTSPEIRKLKLYDPVIEVFNPERDDSSPAIKNLSLTVELGKIYNSVQETITSLNTRSISIINATVILNNQSSEARKPLKFSNIYFSLKRHENPGNRNGSSLANSDVSFSSSNQDITLSDGIHKLMFKRLIIQQAKNLFLDSCTITALSTQSSRNSFDIFFKRLALKGVDFDALYRKGIIRADSVYCLNATTDIVLNSSLTPNKSIREIPDFEKILQEFSGNLDLGFLGVSNADMHFNITGKKKHTNINAGKVNFQIKDLRINPDSSKIVSINTFELLIKDYQLYNGDSSVIYSFDSVRFENDQLLLNNFSVHTAPGINKMRSFRDYSMRYFELLGMDWGELFFRQNLKAKEAILHEPVMNYRKAANVAISKKAILFNSNHSFDDFMEIHKLKIINGKININWSDDNSLQLEDIDVSLFADNITDYKHVKLQKDVQSLSFKNGYLKLGDITAQLHDVSFSPSDNIQLSEVLVKNKQGEINSRIKNVLIKNIYTISERNYVVEGLEWEEGDILVRAIPLAKGGAGKSTVQLKNVSGSQTRFTFVNDKNEVNAFVDHLHIVAFEKNNARQILLNGFDVAGKEINFCAGTGKFHAANFSLSDRYQKFSGVTFNNEANGSEANVAMALLELRGNINSLLTDEHHLDYVIMKSPVINFQKQAASPNLTTPTPAFTMPALQIDHVLLQEPTVNLLFESDGNNKGVRLSQPTEGEVKIEDLQVSPEKITAASIKVNSRNAELIKGNESVFSIDDGLGVEISKLNIPTDKSVDWSAVIDKLSMKNNDGFTFNLKQNKLLLRDISIGDCMVSSSTINNIDEFFTSNPTAWFRTSYARYTTPRLLIHGFNIRYNFDKQMLVLDSVNYRPSLSATDVSEKYPKQVNYITFNAAGATFDGFDIGKYIKQDSLIIQHVSLTRPAINVLRLRFPTPTRKKLFIEQINRIPVPVLINEISINNGKVNYLEKNEKTRLEAKLYLTHLSGKISNINNYSLHHGDSLSLDFTGHLLDAAPFNISVHQSYEDSLYGFAMALGIQPTSLTILNPLLTPLSSLKFTSGTLDKLEMNATGNEHFSRGTMNFYYHKLKIQLLKNDVFTQPTFFKRVESALVNAFFLKKENEDRQGVIYFRRLKDRSFFNYMNKIILSGVSTSVGVKRNKRFRKNILRDETRFKW